MLGTKIKQTLIHGADKAEIVSLVRRALWLKGFGIKREVMKGAANANIPPQVLAAHLLILRGDQSPHSYQPTNMGNKYRNLLAHLGNRWKDRLQAGLFAVAAYEAGSTNVERAMVAAKRYDASLGVSNENFRNWMYVQDFLWGVMKPPEKARNVRKLMFTLIEIMCMIADEFQDDPSPRQRLIT